MTKSTFPASVGQLHSMLQFVSGNALQAGFESDQILQIELALEEAIVNIIEYGYKQAQGCLEIHCFPVDKGLQVKLVDAGMPFNPLMPLEVMPKGGYGILLITKIMDSLKYEYRDGQNILMLTKFH